MTTLTMLSAIGAALVGLLVYALLRIPPCVRKRVILSVKSEPDLAVSGVLWRVQGPWFVLKDATALRSDGKQSRIDGDCVIHQDNVTWMQVTP